jgi:hypothetical protein
MTDFVEISVLWVLSGYIPMNSLRSIFHQGIPKLLVAPKFSKSFEMFGKLDAEHFYYKTFTLYDLYACSFQGPHHVRA